MIFGRRFWILIWYGILFLGVAGLAGALFWGKESRWKNLDEVFRGIGTIAVSAGMLLLLYGTTMGVGRLLLVVALACFLVAFILGRRADRSRQAS